MKLTSAFSSSSERPTRPTRDALAVVVPAAARQDVARVVEMHDRLDALEITIVAIGFDEGWIWPLVHIAQRRHLKAPLVRGDERYPARINGGGLAEQLIRAEKASNTRVDVC